MKRNRWVNLAVVGAVLALMPIGASHAEGERVLTAAEISDALAGNTFSGVFGEENTRYAQRNHRNGMAVVNIEGTPARLIPWFVEEPGSYCEDWAESGVICYRISRDDSSGKHFFQRPNGTVSEFVVQKGFQPFTFE
ncbi:hypothetical protein [Pyruvatibacter sp. HU-CL02332]|uniref:hypothetical protein n=1 Tax=Pyruvatibacter sp. HU-CL02332 TaxID=3127650 RepID=UPI0031053123